MTDLERARAVFGKDRFAVETGCVIEEAAVGYARCTLTVETRHRNALGAPMGGAVFTLADYAFAVASNFDRDVYVSTSADVRFLAAARGTILTAEAREIRCGRRTCLYAVTVVDELGTQVAWLTIGGMLVQVRRRKEK